MKSEELVAGERERLYVVVATKRSIPMTRQEGDTNNATYIKRGQQIDFFFFAFNISFVARSACV